MIFGYFDPEYSFEAWYTPTTTDDRIADLMHVRVGMNKLNTLTATVKVKDLIPGETRRVFEPTVPMLAIGSWRIIPPMPGGAKPYRYVNPRHPDAGMYSDFLTQCPCGTHIIQRDESQAWQREHNHTDDCTRVDFDARVARFRGLKAKYVEFAVTNFGHSLETVTARLGFRSVDDTLELMDEHDIDWSHLQWEWVERRNRLWTHAARYGADLETVALGFDVDVETVEGVVA